MVTQYITKLLSVEEYSFSLDELIQETQKTKNSIWLELAHLIEKNEVVNLRKGFYLILPPRYRSLGKLPLNLYIEKLFTYLNREYYVGFYSAAKVHGASHQQLQRDYVMTKPPKLLDISKSPLGIRFLTTTSWPQGNIEARRSDAGIYNISSPVLTLADLVRYQNKLGGLNRILSTIEELMEEVTESDIKELLTWYDHKATLQRLGFLMYQVTDDTLMSNLIFEHLKPQKTYPILLQPDSMKKPGAVDNKFKIDINIKLESDL